MYELKRGFKEFFPPSSGVRIIAEPGRYFVASALTTICNITSVREVNEYSDNSDTEGNHQHNIWVDPFGVTRGFATTLFFYKEPRDPFGSQSFLKISQSSSQNFLLVS